MDFELPQKGKGLYEFALNLQAISQQIGFKLSARGWAYQLEGLRLINKAEFDKVESLVNKCRRKGYLPIDFTATEEARQFSGIETPEPLSIPDYLKQFLEDSLRCEDWYTPDWWDGEDYYIQMVVEKIDIKTLFGAVCRQYHIPIATSKGWSSMLQRGEYAKRFKQAENKGLNCVLLYCGDHDPDGLRISDFIRANLEDLKDITWSDGAKGYDPSDLIINRFGLNYDFIEENGLTWIDNLETGAKKPCPICGKPKSLADPHHPNHYYDYVQNYLRDIGERKCEANALVIRPREAEELVREAIEKYVGSNALERFEEKERNIREQFSSLREETKVGEAINKALELL